MSLPFVVDPERVAPYSTGPHAPSVMRERGLDEVVRLASNEFPLPPVPGVQDAIAVAIAGLNRYPDPQASELRQAIAAHCGVPADHVAVGNGSAELLVLLGQALLAPDVECVFAEPSFALYRRLCDLRGAAAVAVPLRDHTHDLAAMAAAVSPATALLIVCNPNNPTGTYVDARAVAEFVAEVPDRVLVVIDEAYHEFVDCDPAADATLELVRHHENVCLTRTFSKIYGLGGLRVGYALCGPRVRQALDACRQPFNVNQLAQVAAQEALRRQDEVERRRAVTGELREQLAAGLAAAGVPSVPSQANFVLADLRALDVQGPPPAVARLETRGVLVRDGAAFGLPGWARVSVGTLDEIQFLLDALAEIAAVARG